MDCFCGSGTTLIGAQELNRNWIGIDQSEQAIKVVKERLDVLPKSLFLEKGYEFILEDKKIGIENITLEQILKGITRENRHKSL